jgi:hypothetical protein
MTSKIGPNSDELFEIPLNDAPAPAASLHHLIPPAPETEYLGFYLVQKPVEKLSAQQVIPLFHILSSRIENNLKTSGLYRECGSKTQIDTALAAIKENVNSTVIPNFADINVVTGLIKALFREMDQPLLQPSDHDLFFSAAQESDPTKKRALIHAAISKLPQENQILLRNLLTHCKKVVTEADVNKITAKNLAICFTPNLFKFDFNTMMQQQGLVEFMIKEQA